MRTPRTGTQLLHCRICVLEERHGVKLGFLPETLDGKEHRMVVLDLLNPDFPESGCECSSRFLELKPCNSHAYVLIIGTYALPNGKKMEGRWQHPVSIKMTQWLFDTNMIEPGQTFNLDPLCGIFTLSNFGRIILRKTLKERGIIDSPQHLKLVTS